MKLTRRKLAAAVLPAALARGQNPPATPDEELQAAREATRRNAEALAKFKLPAKAEPAFRFEA